MAIGKRFPDVTTPEELYRVAEDKEAVPQTNRARLAFDTSMREPAKK